MFLILNDFGTEIALTVVDLDCVAVDISAATLTEFELIKPDGTIVTKTASFVTDGSDGRLKYVIESGVVDVVGTWAVRVKVTEGATKVYRTERVDFDVKN